MRKRWNKSAEKIQKAHRNAQIGRNMKIRKTEFFSETTLAALVSLVTLLLQLISFATTWSGSRIYLEGVFPYASLFFAIAIQATAYFFSNSLRTKAGVLKLAALLMALCCSTYYSYIGIYNSVNSPARYLQERYVQIGEELTGLYRAGLEENIGSVRTAINDSAYQITARYTRLINEQKNLEACRQELALDGKSYAESLRAPRQSTYANYEDYVAAYRAYVEGISFGSNTEKEANRDGILAAYGFADMAQFQSLEAENAAARNALKAALGLPETEEEETVPATISDMTVSLLAAADAATMGQSPDEETNIRLNRLLQAAGLCGAQETSASEIVNIVNLTAEVTKTPLIAAYSEVTASLEEGRVTDSNTMDLKNAMDAEILSALLKLNHLLPEGECLSLSDTRYGITDLYLIPMEALRNADTRMTALFCLGMAALVDALSLLFAVSLRKRKPIWERNTLLFCRQEELAPQIYASLPALSQRGQALSDFLAYFGPSPETEGDGYMMRADADHLKGYESLVALLCQINLAKLVPASVWDGSAEEGSGSLLLKAKFVFWANSVIYEEKRAS